MSKKPILNPEEWVITFNDVKQLYIAKRKTLIKWAMLGVFLAFLWVGSSAPQYKAEATFKEGVEKNSPDSFLKEIVVGISSSQQPQAASFMKSYQVLRPLVEKMGLQIVSSKSRGLIPKIIHRFKEIWRAERGIALEEGDPFLFEQVVYQEEHPFAFQIFFEDESSFCIYSKDKKQLLAKGYVGSEICLASPHLQFTLLKVPNQLRIKTYYPFQAAHWASVVAPLREQVKIKEVPDNKSLIHISICHRDRHLAARIINELMEQYQFYLKNQFDHTAKEQLAYLEKKQEQVFKKMDELFDQHTHYLRENLQEEGFFALEAEAENLLAPHQKMQAQMSDIEVELTRLDQIEKEGASVYVTAENAFGKDLNQTSQKIQDLKQQRDLIELSFCQVDQEGLESKREELKEIRTQRYFVEKLIQEVERGDELSSFDIQGGLGLWAREIRDPDEREDFSEYLQNYGRLLSLREKMLQERFFYGNSPPPELEGIDLLSARNLFQEYNSKLVAAEAAMRHYAQFKKQIPQSDFEIASLSSVLQDSLCQKIIEDASALSLQLKDEAHHSSKEKNRWEEQISLYRKILSDHLDQLYKVEELDAALIREKMAGLQKVSLDCINRQISVLHEQVADLMKQRRQSLLLEKSLLEKKMGEIRTCLGAMLPEKWRLEKWLSVKADMVNKVMGAVTEVVESKTISSHLHHVESKPLDHALVPLEPVRPKLFKTACFSALLLPFLIFCFSAIREIFKGLPATLEKLKALQFPVLGPLSSFCDGPSVGLPAGPDLELLRKLSLFIEGSKVISLIGGRGPDYSFAFAENIARRSEKSIVLRCDFLSKFRKEDTPGLLQLWKGELTELPIRKAEGFDYIMAGGYSPFGTEIIQSQNFIQLVELLKKNYNWVFLFFRTPLSSAESDAALRVCEKAVVTVCREQIEELTPFVNWAYHEDCCRLTFITTS